MNYYGVESKVHKGIIIVAINLLFISSLFLWGGIGRFDTVDGPEIAGLIRYQDLFALLSSCILLAYLIRDGKVPQWFFLLGGGVLFLIIYGTLIGIANGNNLQNIALEVRPFIYVFYGLIVAAAVTPKLLGSYLILYASIAAIIFILQFIVVLIVGESGIFTTETHLGNAFTLNLPLVRPQAFHLVVIGLILAFTRLNKMKYLLLVLLLGLALLITQSKTYWLFVALFMGAFFIISKKITINRKVILVTASSVLLIGATLILAISPNNSTNPYSLVIKKFSDVFTSSEISYGVVGIRLEESDLLMQPIIDEPPRMLYGHGLGYLYREQNSLFYRAAERDQQRLAMFGHNFYLWMLLKVGMVGVGVFLLITLLPILFGSRGGTYQQNFVYCLLAVLFSAIFLGTFESPLGGFLLGLLLAGAIKSTRSLPTIPDEKILQLRT